KLFFQQGDGPFKVHKIREARVGVLICFDWIFPEATRILALKGMTVLAHSANLVLPFCQTAMLARSVENKIFTLTANRIGTEINGDVTLSFTGKSQITSPKMEVLSQASEDKEAMEFVSIDPKIAENKNLNTRNNLFLDRRTELYGELVKKVRIDPKPE
ncbi:MAG: nitrilase-related carbon-nitrogen hydrolase, partial [Candidatus Heimdallarchaeaceae archaeon]